MEIKQREFKDRSPYYGGLLETTFIQYEVRYKCYKKFVISVFQELTEEKIEKIILKRIKAKDECVEFDFIYIPVYLFKSIFKNLLNKKPKQEVSEEKKISIELNLRNKGFVKDGSFYRKDSTCIDLSNNTIWHDGISKVKSMFDLNDLDIFINNFSRI